MSAVPLEPSLDLRAPDYADNRQLPFPAVLYLWLVVAVAVAVAAPLVAGLGLDTRGWTTFAILGVAVAIAQGLAVDTGSGRTDHTAVVFVVAAALLLPPELVALVAVVQHVPDWLKRRFPLRMQAFNVASMTLAALAVRLSAHEIHVRQPFGRGGATTRRGTAPATRKGCAVRRSRSARGSCTSPTRSTR
jgi:hypothetical protein